MDKPVAVEAFFLAASDPVAVSRFYADGLGLGEPSVTADGQYAFTGTGVFFAIEPLGDAPGAADGEVTVWYRVADVSSMLSQLTAAGAVVLQPLTDADDEVVAVVRAPGGNRIGLIG